MHKLMIAPLLGVVLAGCEAQDNFTIKSKDSGTQQAGGSGGKGGASTTGGMSGSAITTGGGGSNGTAGSAGSSGSSGAGGTAGTDTSSDAGPDTSVALADAEAGAGYPDASTCAGYAVQFTGFASGTVPTRPVQDDFTLEAWIKTTDSRIGANNFFEGNGLIYADVGGIADDFGTSILNDKFAFGVGNPDTTILSTTSVDTGAWIHVAATRKMSTGEIQVFVNGTMEASAIVALQTRSLTASASLTLGANTVDSRFFTGTMDEVRIWSVVRTQAEISTNMHKRVTGTETGLAGYYRFDQPGSDTAKDLSVKMGDASLIGPPDWVVSDAPICN